MGQAAAQHTDLETAIESAWDARDTLSPDTSGEMREAMKQALALLDTGALRVAEKRLPEHWRLGRRH